MLGGQGSKRFGERQGTLSLVPVCSLLDYLWTSHFCICLEVTGSLGVHQDLNLSPGFPFMQALFPQPVSPLGCAQPAACRTLSTEAEELLAIGVP